MNFESIIKFGDHFCPEDIMGKEMFIEHYEYACGVGDGALKAFCLDALAVYDKHGICTKMEWTRVEDGGRATITRPNYAEMAPNLFPMLHRNAWCKEQKKFYKDMIKVYEKHPGVHIRRGR